MLNIPFSPTFLRKAGLWSGGILAVIAAIGFLVVPAVLRPVLEQKISEAIHRTVSVRKLSFNPFALSLALRGVTINQRDSSEVMLSFDEFSVNLEAMSAVKRGLIVSSVRLVRPYVRIARNKDLTYSFSDLLAPAPAGQPAGKEPREPLRFSINNIEVQDGSADLFDAPRNTRHTVRNVNISVPFVSNLPYDLTSYVEPFFEATINNNAFVLRGKTRPFDESRETTVDVELKDLDLPYYLAYSPVPLNVRLLSGKLDVQVSIAFRQFKDRQPTVSLKGTVALKEVLLADREKKRLAELSRFSLSFLPSDLMTKTVHLSDISLVAPKLYVERDRNGELGIIKALVPEAPKRGGTPEAAAAEAPAAAAEAASLPIIDIDAVSMSDGMVLFTDLLPGAEQEQTEDAAGPARLRIDRMTLKGRSLSTRSKSKGAIELSLNINRTGFLRASGTLGLNPVDVDAQVNIGGLSLTPFQPYVARTTLLLLADGRVAAAGRAQVAREAGKGLSASFRGNASLDRLRVLDSRGGGDLLAWRSLRFEGIDAGSGPLRIRIGTIALSDLSAAIVVEEDGVLNLRKIIRKGPVAEKEPAGDKKQEPSPAEREQAPVAVAPPDISLRKVVVSNGKVGFVDKYVQPQYTAGLAGIEGMATGLSSREDVSADIALSALFDQYAPLSIAGKINPLRKELFVDVKTDFKDMELSTLTPYAGTYIGRAVEKGKLSLGLEYHIARKKLDAKNRILIDQLTLGEKIESPKATNLPVGLALSLLRDRKGEIRFDIPVSGEIDNPEFSVWRIVLQVLGNLLVKAATSPFALLGSLVSGGEELGYVEFDDGAATVAEQNRQKLNALAGVLYERPALKLEIAGYADPVKDGEALRADRMKSLIVEQKVRELSRAGVEPPPGSAQVSAEEYPVYLRKAYRSGKFSKPRNMFGIARDLPDAEMEQLLLASIQVTDGDLRQLAATRSRAVKELILKTQRVEPERVFLLEPKSLLPEQKEKLRNSRVDFTLK